jgi:hypothetical protein
MRQIPLTQGQVALVDDEDYAILGQFKWYALRKPNTFYAMRNVRSTRTASGHTAVKMHQVIMEAEGRLVDHENGNGLDNRRHNLRFATVPQNQHNSGRQVNNTSGYKGVWRDRGGWRTAIRVNGRRLNLGTFGNPIDAARAYDAAARQHHGEFAQLNFAEAS